MPKLKTKSGAKKRFRFTANGKIKHGQTRKYSNQPHAQPATSRSRKIEASGDSSRAPKRYSARRRHCKSSAGAALIFGDRIMETEYFVSRYVIGAGWERRAHRRYAPHSGPGWMWPGRSGYWSFCA